MDVEDLFTERLLDTDRSARCTLSGWRCWSDYQWCNLYIDAHWLHLESRLRVEIRADRRVVAQYSIRVERSTYRETDRTYLICPKSEKRVETLYLVDWILAAREVHDLRYPPRGSARRLTVADRNAAAAQRENIKFWEQEKKRKAAEAERDRLYDQQRDDPTTRAALRRFGHQHPRYVENSANQMIKNLDRDNDDSKPNYTTLNLPMAILEDHPMIDIRVLAAEGYLRRGERTIVGLDWSCEPGRVFVMFNLMERSSPWAGILFARGVAGRDVLQQVFELTPPPDTGRHRYSFICPNSGKPAEVLAYRGGRFAPRQAQRLVNRSQRKTKP